MKIVLLGILAAVLWNSPEARVTTAQLLRVTADWIEPTQATQENPKNFVIPNPFYMEQK